MSGDSSPTPTFNQIKKALFRSPKSPATNTEQPDTITSMMIFLYILEKLSLVQNNFWLSHIFTNRNIIARPTHSATSGHWHLPLTRH